MKRVHLVCNAHLDPVWQWPWQEGWAETLSTFRVAADFCERHPDFVFTHNEMLLYRWVEAYEPQLFERIRKLVAAGRWRIAGGAYLQPDVNSPHGESHVRQFLLARRWFEDRFGTCPTTAYNYDPFGHPEGYAQVLAACGMRHYVFCRPGVGKWDLPLGPFRWRDRSGSEVIARRSDDHYDSSGDAVAMIEEYLEHYRDEPVSMILWGIGNHGGGPSRLALQAIEALRRRRDDIELVHSDPDTFFAEALRARPAAELPTVEGGIQNVAPGCLVSMARLKRAYRATEAELLAVEARAALVWWHRLADHPADTLADAWRDVLFAEFHDILPGSGSPVPEADSLRLLARARENLERLHLRLLHATVRGEPPAADGATPIFAANPHAFPLRTQIEFELHPGIYDHERDERAYHLHIDGRKVPCQHLRADAVCGGRQRVRLAAEIDLPASGIVRIEQSHEARAGKTPRLPRTTRRNLTFNTRYYRLRIDPATGLIAHFGLPRERRPLLQPGAGAPALFADLDHSWRCGTPRGDATRGFLEHLGFTRRPDELRLASPRRAHDLHPTRESKLHGGPAVVPPLRIVEHGALLTVVEAVLVHGPTTVVRRYLIRPRHSHLEIRDRVTMNHRDHMLKLALPLAFPADDCLAETCYSAEALPPDAEHVERPNQRWVAVRGKRDGKPRHLTVLNDSSYAHALCDGTLWIDSLRTPAYSSFNLGPADDWRHACIRPRMDIGEHELRFALLPGARCREADLRRAADAFNRPPHCQIYFPQPERVERRRRTLPADTITVEDPAVQITALKRSENGRELIVRLLETGGRPRRVTLHVKPYRKSIRLEIGAHRLASVAIARGRELRWRQVDLVERKA